MISRLTPQALPPDKTTTSSFLHNNSQQKIIQGTQDFVQNFNSTPGKNQELAYYECTPFYKNQHEEWFRQVWDPGGEPISG